MRIFEEVADAADLLTNLRGELDPEVAVFSEARGKEVEKHSTFKLVPHQARVSSARKEILELATS